MFWKKRPQFLFKKDNYKVIQVEKTFNLHQISTTIKMKDGYNYHLVPKKEKLYLYTPSFSLHDNECSWYQGIKPKDENLVELNQYLIYHENNYALYDQRFTTFEIETGINITVQTQDISKMVNKRELIETIIKTQDALEKIL